jgi:hypothetical protein
MGVPLALQAASAISQKKANTQHTAGPLIRLIISGRHPTQPGLSQTIAHVLIAKAASAL